MPVVINTHAASGLGQSTDQQLSINSLSVVGAIDFFWTRQNNEPFQPFSLAAQATGTVNGAGFGNSVCRGGKFFIDVTAITAGSVTINIQVQDPYSGKWVTILSSAAIAAVSTVVLTVYPGMVAAANLVANDVITRAYRIQAVVVTGPVTLTVGASLVV